MNFIVISQFNQLFFLFLYQLNRNNYFCFDLFLFRLKSVGASGQCKIYLGDLDFLFVLCLLYDDDLDLDLHDEMEDDEYFLSN